MKRVYFDNKIGMLPIKFILAYLVFTVILYVFNPNFETNNPVLLYSYVLSSFALLFMGFKTGFQKKRSKLFARSNGNKLEGTIEIHEFVVSNKVFWLLVVCQLILLHITLYDRKGIYFFDLYSLSDFGSIYKENILFNESRGRSYIEWTRIILSPITLGYFPIGILTWNRRTIIQKVIYVYLVLGNILLLLVSGINKGFADAIILLFAYILIAIYRGGKFRSISERFTMIKKKIRTFVACGLVFLAIFILVFTISIASRQSETVSVDTAYRYFTGYLSQGYKGLDYAFDHNFDTTFGLGCSMYLLKASQDWFGSSNIISRSYVYKNEAKYGWNMSIRWSSIYVWIGNDISLFGAWIFMYFIGIFFGSIWIEALTTNNIFSVILGGLMVQLCFYIPANNQIVQTAEALFGFIVTLMLYLCTKKWVNHFSCGIG